jgi:hypothetical protein
MALANDMALKNAMFSVVIMRGICGKFSPKLKILIFQKEK